MSDFTKGHPRQIKSRDQLQQLAPNISGAELDNLLRSANADLTFLLRMDSSNPADRVVNVGPAVVSNSETNRSRSIPHIQSVIPNFVGGTITFPAFDGGNIVVSPGINQALNLPVGQFSKVLISLDSSGNLAIIQGAPNAVEANASVPAPVQNTLPIGYVGLHNTGGTVDNIVQAKIVQFDRVAPVVASGGGGGGAGWVANSQPIPNGSDTVAISFATAQNDTSYIVLPMIENTVDANPQALIPQSVIKTVNGFTVKLNAPTDSNNYKLNYIVPLKAFHMAEVALGNGASNVSPVFGIPDNGANYGLIAVLQNIVDAAPQFQPLVVTSKSSTGFTAKLNAPTDSGDYKVVYLKMATAEVALGLGVTSANVDVPVNYGNSNYAIVAVMHNLVDANPQFQPMWISAKSGSGFTVEWEDPTDSVNYKLVYYAISYA
jgi:hypothetical protein